MGLVAAQVNRSASPLSSLHGSRSTIGFVGAARIKPDMTKWTFQTRHSFSSPIAGKPGVR